MKEIFFITLLLFLTRVTFAQSSVDANAADFLRKSDSIYVVISVLVTIFAGIIAFLVFQERKISKLEKQIKDKHP
jgi:uncharacterized membrane protein